MLIAPEAYLEAAQPLLERRRDQGLTALGVSFEEITSQFGHGRPSAEAIRDFLAYAYHEWTGPSLRYVLLLGDSSYDPRNFTGLDQGAPLPALWAKTSYLWTSSDPTLGAINGEDLLPDVAIGRLPAKTLEEAQALVQKVLDWEGQDLGGKAVLVADNPDLAGDFEADVLDIEASYLTDRETQRLFLRELGAGTRPQILSAFDGGASLMSYVGHGGAAVWASENVLNSWDPPKLLAQSQTALDADVQLPQRLLRGPELRLFVGGVPEGGGPGDGGGVHAVGAEPGRPGAPVPPGADGGDHGRRARASRGRGAGGAGGVRGDGGDAGAARHLSPPRRSGDEDSPMRRGPAVDMPSCPTTQLRHGPMVPRDRVDAGTARIALSLLVGLLFLAPGLVEAQMATGTYVGDGAMGRKHHRAWLQTGRRPRQGQRLRPRHSL